MNEGYSICLNKWALDKTINGELGLLLIISSLCAEKGYCYANNKYLAELFDVPEVTISRKLRKLKEKGYIDIQYVKKGCEVISREIRLTNLLTDDYQNRQSTINKNVKENNISINNIKEISKESSALEEKLEYNFGVLWEEYPRKKGKAQAYKHYKGIMKAKKLSNEDILTAITRYKEYIAEQKIKEQYIMHGSTFFCSGMYDYLNGDDDT